jgi:hypothetical protein
MLDPRDRTLFFEALRPPPGYQLDQALATTFSLDLMTLLTVPLAFTFFDWEDREGRPTSAPHAVLESLRRYASRMSIFCQAGRIAVPGQRRLLFGYLEDSVVEVTAPRGGVFHPKLTVLRFAPEGSDGDQASSDEPVCYRILCASRNLTFDRSWDTLLTLEGELANRKNAISASRPLGEFIDSLPGLALHAMADDRAARIRQIGYELMRTRFEPPEEFDEVRFWPLGVDGASGLPIRGRIDRLLVLSPFLDKGLLDRVTEAGREDVLISRCDELARTDRNTLSTFGDCYFLDPAADDLESPTNEDEAAEDGPNAPIEEDADSFSDGKDQPLVSENADQLRGLHAKLYVMDSGFGARILTGSANATSAAFSKNVEFLVELVSSRRRHKIRNLLARGGKAEEKDPESRVRFGDLLQEYAIDQEVEPADEVRESVERQIDHVRSMLVNANLEVHVADTAGSTDRQYDVQLETARPISFETEDPVKVTCWPITLREEFAESIATLFAEPVVRFKRLSLEAITPFMAFCIQVEHGKVRGVTRFVLNLPLHGAPEDRRNRLLLAMLKDRSQLLRYLLMLLASDGWEARQLITEIARAKDDKPDQDGHALGVGLPLLEPMLRALDREPAKLDQVASLVAELKGTDEGRALLPEEFDEVWEPIWQAWKEVRHGG